MHRIDVRELTFILSNVISCKHSISLFRDSVPEDFISII